MKTESILPVGAITFSLCLWALVLAGKHFDLPWSVREPATAGAAKEAKSTGERMEAKAATAGLDASAQQARHARKKTAAARPKQRRQHARRQLAMRKPETRAPEPPPAPEKRKKPLTLLDLL